MRGASSLESFPIFVEADLWGIIIPVTADTVSLTIVIQRIAVAFSKFE
jgi:hypothetical protein